MCYPKPGPRCSAHAKQRLQKLKQRQSDMAGKMPWEDLYQMEREIAEAELEFDSTPVGQSVLQMQIDNYAGEPEAYYAEYQERLDLAREYRAKQLDAVNTKEQGDILSHGNKTYVPAAITSPELLSLDEVRKERAGLDDVYKESSADFAETLDSKQATAVAWYTSSGFQNVNRYLRDGTLDDQEKVANMTKKAVPALDAAYNHIPADAPRNVLYRGLRNSLSEEIDYSLSREEAVERVREKYPVDSTIQDGTYKSATYSSNVGASFSGVGNPVIMEIEARRAIPVGHYSAWEHHEREAIIDRRAKLEVVNIGTATYELASRTPGKKRHKEIIVIQCREVD